jgi:histidine triad (HIT) family protein
MVSPAEARSGCIFCQIADGKAPAERIYEDEATVAFMDINPATDGHCLVIPRRHAEDIWSLDEDDGVFVWRTAHRVARVVREALNANGVNLLQASGRVAFQTEFHYHVHIIPRYSREELTPPWISRPGDPKRIADTAGRLRDAVGRV